MLISNSLPLITDFELSQIEQDLIASGEAGFRAKQIWQGIYHSQVEAFSEISNLPIKLREKLISTYKYSSLEKLHELHSRDKQTTKYLFDTSDNNKIETVIMRYNTRNTLCISTQSGCAMGCVFCATGQMGYYRNLSPGEIVEQILFCSRTLNAQGKTVTNIVFMGMGEPFHNYDSTLKAIDILGDKNGYNFGARRMTISTVGLVPQIIRFADEKRQVNLAVSLHSVDNIARSKMMPINKKYPVEELLSACDYYVQQTHRRVSFEWALIEGINDDVVTARALSKKLHSMLCHVNLIQLNPTNKFAGTGSSSDTAIKFKETLESAGIQTSIRLKRGIDINAGCGQLASTIN